MNFSLNFYSAALLLAAAIALWHAIAVMRRPAGVTPSITAFLLGMAWWCVAYALHWSHAPQPYPSFWLEATYVGVVAIPTAFFAFTLRYTGHDRWFTRRWLMLATIEPILTLLLLWTDSRHGLFFGGLPRDGSPLFNGGPWFWINVIYSYGLMLTAVVLLAQAYKRATHFYKGQARMILVGALLPWAVNALMLAGFNPLPGLDLTPFAFTLTGLAFTYGVRNYRLLDIIPVARDTLIEKMADGVIVLDTQNRLVDINPTGQWMLRARGRPPIGQPIEPLLAHWQNLVERFREIQDGQFELQIEDDLPIFVDLLIAPLSDATGRYTGRLLVLRDISRLKQTELKLRQANEELHDRIHQIERLQTQLQEQAICDGLTGLYNRRYLEEALAREISQAAEEGQPLALLMLDIDHFKGFNDTHGHSAGDMLLQHLAGLLKGLARTGCIVCRYGGEEFVVVMPGAGIEQATERGQEICDDLAKTSVLHRGTQLRITVSVGVAAYPVHAHTPAELLHSADQA
ncbi:MAG: histidine kinase N-terminal 7TM domain-containing protein, partial [Caldilineaceae bacterium]